MNTRETERPSPLAAEREALLRSRLAASRAELLAKSVALKVENAQRAPSWPVRGLELVKTAPNVTLLAAVLVGTLVVGPRKIALVVVRNGLAGWVGKNVRRRAGQ
ncbi:hypothetical protein PPMP20_24150 [Paraburkholderia phymatum]|uniref:Uncharacterized protein n=1 Tax=Paraburkholderia phymatum (strain DSM 17167 / CIP 108236 / LMG 21445 / STM815) TaxID=391038 RepID=B2JR32_PARP8|nr:hypothetical protein [Paraburkholderia phymatum]ACC73723.1 hypothetical protein Bphy_4613 [Paraburkholderia phymatum STM815]